jgi:ribosome-associated toxin RatA of RatAB toxin-antitoxin module
VEFRLQYTFANAVLEKLIAPVFSHIAATFVDAFVARAEEFY